MTTDAEPSAPRGRRPGRSLVRWLTAAVVVALAVVAGAAFLADRGRVEQSDGVSFVTATADTVSEANQTPSDQTPAADGTPSTDGSPTAPASATSAAPTPTPTEAPPRVVLSSPTVGIGETLAIRVFAPEAGGASVVANGSSYPLLPEDGGFLFGVIGFPLNAAIGPAELALTIRDDFGQVLEQRAVPIEVTTVDRPVDYLSLTEEQGSVLTPEASIREAQLRAEQFLTFDRQRHWDGLFRMPVEGFATTEFGQGRSINGGPVGGFHSGADLASEAGTLIQAAAPGRIAWVGEMPIRGNSVIIDHGGGVKTGYHHLQAILVEAGQEVAAGTVIGEMGSTGLSTGPHLHWELTIYGVNVDPKTWTTVDFTG